MTTNSKDSQDQSLADTCIEYKHSEEAAPAAEARGCLLQIYPVPTNPGLSRLSAPRSVLGQDPASQVPVDDTSVSRIHASIEWTDGAYYVTDLNSTNGTWVNETRVRSQVKLQGGELLRLGNTILKFMLALDEEAQYHAVVHDLITHDQLTGVFNRAYLLRLLQREVETSIQQGSSMSIILVDIDRFKRVNDRYGHLVGDEVLRTFCDRLRRVLDKKQALCRFGGEELVWVCPETPMDMGARFAEMMRQQVAEEPFVTQAGSLKLTCSMGVTHIDGSTETSVDELLTAADRLLYQAKEQGRNCVRRADVRRLERRSDATWR